MSYLVSALNILNEFEINYKMARNKRLHVELALIKLNYLQQALELVNDNGNVIKKKRVDAPVIYKTKAIEADPVLPAKKTEAKLVIQQPGVKTITEEKPVAVKTAIATKAQASNASFPKSANGKGLLEALREKVGADYNIEEVKDAEALTHERLNEAWNEYAASIEPLPNKHSTVQTLRNAKLDIEADNFFTVTVHALTQQKFIEQERTMLCDFLQTAFNNRSINFKILVEAGAQEEIPIYLTLNSRQKFERIAEKYPLVKELKNKLNLDIDY